MTIRICNTNLPIAFTSIVLIVIVLLISLGNWQLRRLDQKENLIESVLYSIQNDPIKITTPEQLRSINSNTDTDIKPTTESLKLFSKIELVGNFSQDNIFLYGKRSANPEKDGYYVLSPFKAKVYNNTPFFNTTANSQKGEDETRTTATESKLEYATISDPLEESQSATRLGKQHDEIILLVMRAWVPQSIKTKMDNGEILLNNDNHGENTTIEAIIMPPETKPFFAPANDLDKNIWFHVMPEDAVTKYGVNLTDFYLRQINNTLIPASMQSLNINNLVHIRNDHLEYAITWYLLAGAVLICFVLYCKKFKIQSI